MSADAGFAVVIPMANEAADFHPFLDDLTRVMESLCPGTVYFVIDRISKDETLSLCHGVSDKDPWFTRN